jgi:uncharacterized protein YyaL (SSP411 family)
MQRRRMLTGWVVPLLLLIGVGVLGAIRGGRAGGDIVWASSFEAGLAQAQQSGKPILLSFHTPGCGWCRKLDAETFTDAKVLELSHHYVCVRVDSDVDGDVVGRFRVLEYPMTMILSPKGTEVARFAGYVAPETYARALETLLMQALGK